MNYNKIDTPIILIQYKLPSAPSISSDITVGYYGWSKCQQINRINLEQLCLRIAHVQCYEETLKVPDV